MRAWEIRQRKAQKRARELARKERQRIRKETETFHLIVGTREPIVVDSVIGKEADESVFSATFDEVEVGMTLIVEGEDGLIQRAVVEEKHDPGEAEGAREVRARVE